MTSVIFRTIAPLIVAIMLVFSFYVCLRGHNEPGGGFIGGLIAAGAVEVLGLAMGVPQTRKALRFDPVSVAAAGVLMAILSGLASLFTGSPFMTSIWFYVPLEDVVIPLSTPLFFDLGVYLTVFGSLTAVGLALESDTDEEDL